MQRWTRLAMNPEDEHTSGWLRRSWECNFCSEGEYLPRLQTSSHPGVSAVLQSKVERAYSKTSTCQKRDSDELLLRDSAVACNDDLVQRTTC